MNLSGEHLMRMPGGVLSKLLMTVEPVVVTPDTDSKKTSVMPRCSDDVMNCTAPAIASVIQKKLTRKKPKQLLDGESGLEWRVQ